MVNLFSSLPSMDFKRIAFPDQLLSSHRRKVVSPCSFGIVLSFIVLSVLLFGFSSKGPFLQGLYNLGLQGNTSFVSWRYPSAFGSNTTSRGCDGASSFGCNNHSVVRNETLVGNVTVSNDMKSGAEGAVLGSGPVGNQTVKFEDGSVIVKGSFGLEEDARNGSQSVGNVILVDGGGNATESGPRIVGYSIDNVSNDSVRWKGDGVRVELGGGYMSENLTANPSSSNGGDGSFKKCDIFNGRWVRDDSKPYYPAGSCPYIDRDFDCHLNGRPDSEYVKWRWQPYDCDIPRLNVTDFLERLRGKKLVFVGDSLNRNMWESLVCILRHGVADKSRVYEISGKHEFKKKGFYAFRFEDYNCSVDFVSSPFLVKESSINGNNGSSSETLRLDLMDDTTSMYHDADVIIFNTGHWWTHEKTSRGEGYYQEGNYVHPRLKVLEAYKRALTTWGRWVDTNIDSGKTEVIFRGYSVTHFRGGPWNAGGQCNNETEPIMNDAYLDKYPAKMRVAEYVLRDVKTPVVYLNISRLTDYRKDGHPSVYRPDYLAAQEIHAQDCSHWCLPGVPDTWNELLYASLLKGGRGSWKG